MRKFIDFMKNTLRNEEGVTAMEYALMGALIAVVIIGTVTAVGLNVQALFLDVADKVAVAIAGAF